MTHPRFDHVGITVLDLDAAITFFTGLGLEPESEVQVIEGEFVSTVVGLPDVRVENVVLRPPGGGAGVELSRFLHPLDGREPQALPASAPGLCNVCFEVDDLRSTVDRLAAEGHPMVGDVGQYEEMWLMAYVRGPEGIIVSLAESLR